MHIYIHTYLRYYIIINIYIFPPFFLTAVRNPSFPQLQKDFPPQNPQIQGTCGYHTGTRPQEKNLQAWPGPGHPTAPKLPF